MRIFNARDHWQATHELIRLLTRHRQLTWEMTKRGIGDRYAGQFFGVVWAFIHPLVLMGIYMFVFSFVFKQKLGGSVDLPRDFSVFLMSGLIPWFTFMECLNDGSTAILNHSNLVKQVVFPIEILPVKTALAAAMTQVISTLILIVYTLLTSGTLPLTYLLWPVLFVIHILGMIGTAYLLSAFGVYFRDLKDFIRAFCTVGIFLLPIVYRPGLVPELFEKVLYLNPYSYFVWCFQDVCYYGRIEHPVAWVVAPLLGLSLFYIGYRVFRKLEVCFGSVL